MQLSPKRGILIVPTHRFANVREAAMGAADKSTFDPLDLEIIDRVYEAAWAKLIAHAPVKNGDDEASRQTNLRQRLFALSQPGRVGFDELYDHVLSSYDKPRTTPLTR
jgi:hypothetical protein